MIKCSHCGALQDDDALFCASCGTKIEIGRHCVHCGALIDEDSLFCSSCGGRQDDGHNTSEESPSHPLPQSVPPVQSQQDVPVEPPSEDEIDNDNNNKRKTIIIIACIVAVLLLCLGGWIAYQKLSVKERYDEDDDEVEMAEMAEDRTTYHNNDNNRHDNYEDRRTRHAENRSRTYVSENATNTRYSYDIACNRYLSDNDLIGLSKQELRIMRNWIFARHGYAFKSKDLQDYFSQFEWYYPQFTDVTDKLSEIELTNIELIKRYE